MGQVAEVSKSPANSWNRKWAKPPFFWSFVQAQFNPYSVNNSFSPIKLAQLPIKKAHGAKTRGLSHFRGDGSICGIHDPDVSMLPFRAPYSNFGSVNFWIRSSKVANERVLFDKSVGNMTFRGELWLFCVFSQFLKDCGQVARVRARGRVFVSKGLGLAKIGTCISRNLSCTSYEMEEKPVTLRLGYDFTCGFRLWLGIHAPGLRFPTRVAFF